VARHVFGRAAGEAMPLMRLRRPVGILLMISVTLSGCASSVRIDEHRHDLGSAVSVRVVDEDARVGGIDVTLARLADGPPAPATQLTATTTADAPVFFGELQPGRYRVALTAPGLARVERTFDLRPDRRASVKVDLAALVPSGESGGSGAGAAAVEVLKGIGFVLALILIVGLFVLAVAALDSIGDDDDDCDECHGHADDCCACACHR
jgi:hypothetical protein